MSHRERLLNRQIRPKHPPGDSLIYSGVTGNNYTRSMPPHLVNNWIKSATAFKTQSQKLTRRQRDEIDKLLLDHAEFGAWLSLGADIINEPHIAR